MRSERISVEVSWWNVARQVDKLGTGREWKITNGSCGERAAILKLDPISPDLDKANPHRQRALLARPTDSSRQTMSSCSTLLGTSVGPTNRLIRPFFPRSMINLIAEVGPKEFLTMMWRELAETVRKKNKKSPLHRDNSTSPPNRNSLRLAQLEKPLQRSSRPPG